MGVIARHAEGVQSRSKQTREFFERRRRDLPDAGQVRLVVRGARRGRREIGLAIPRARGTGSAIIQPLRLRGNRRTGQRDEYPDFSIRQGRFPFRNFPFGFPYGALYTARVRNGVIPLIPAFPTSPRPTLIPTSRSSRLPGARSAPITLLLGRAHLLLGA